MKDKFIKLLKNENVKYTALGTLIAVIIILIISFFAKHQKLAAICFLIFMVIFLGFLIGQIIRVNYKPKNKE